jgi:hypothetical protein
MVERVPLHWAPGEKPVYAFCESTQAAALAPWHIRKLSEGGLKLGGGIDTPSLCEKLRPMGDHTATRVGGGGWDLNVRITDGHLDHCCKDCAERYRKVVAP